MEVTVRLHATLRRHTSEGYQSRLTLELEDGDTVASVLNSLELDVEPKFLMVVIDRRRVELEHTLGDGDEIDLFPPISGGKLACKKAGLADEFQQRRLGATRTELGCLVGQ